MDQPLGTIVSQNNSRLEWIKHRKNQYILAAIVAALLIAILLIVSLVNANNNSTVTNNVATSNPILDSYKAKIPDLQNKLDKDPNNVTAIHDLAVALYATGDLEGAKELYQKEIDIKQNDPVLYNNLGNTYRDSGDYQKAVEAYKKSIELDNKQTNAYLNLANLYLYTLSEVDMGINTLKNAIENNPDNAESMYLQIANSYSVLNKKDLAKETYNKVLEINPNNASANNALKNL